MAKYYFIYGTSSCFPFRGGWTEVEAADLQEAVSAFRAYHPDRANGGCVNCADIYTEDAFKAAQFEMTGNLGSFCRERITMSRETLETGGE